MCNTSFTPVFLSLQMCCTSILIKHKFYLNTARVKQNNFELINNAVIKANRKLFKSIIVI